MLKFSYVILHYKNIKDTLECMQSIRQKFSSPIIVVDNYTLSKEEEDAIRQYTDDILLLDDNYGFAKANNQGISYAVSKYRSDFVVVINNDIVITQENFESQIQKVFQETNFDLLGPKIITKEGDSVNPFPVYKNLEEVSKAIQKTKRNIKIFQSDFLSLLFQIYHKLKYRGKKVKHLENGMQRVIPAALHGCAIIFSKKYLQRYQDAFYSGTFLYHEEEFLYYRVCKDQLISCYDPSVFCFHKEGSSLKQQFEKQNRKRELFRNQEILKSLEQLRVIMEEKKEI